MRSPRSNIAAATYWVGCLRGCRFARPEIERLPVGAAGFAMCSVAASVLSRPTAAPRRPPFVNASYLQGFSHADHRFAVWSSGCQNCDSWNDRACQVTHRVRHLRRPVQDLICVAERVEHLVTPRNNGSCAGNRRCARGGVGSESSRGTTPGAARAAVAARSTVAGQRHHGQLLLARQHHSGAPARGVRRSRYPGDGRRRSRDGRGRDACQRPWIEPQQGQRADVE